MSADARVESSDAARRLSVAGAAICALPGTLFAPAFVWLSVTGGTPVFDRDQWLTTAWRVVL